MLTLTIGLFLYGASTVQETGYEAGTRTANPPVPPHTFSYDGETLGDSSHQQEIVGTTGVADIMILNTSVWDFSGWMCPVAHQGCGGWGEFANYLNITYLDSYLQTHSAQLMFSRTIINENLTVVYPVSAPTNVTIVMAHIGSNATRDFWMGSWTHQTLSYPILGYTENAAGTIRSLPNIALGTIFASLAAIIVVAKWMRGSPPQPLFSSKGIFEKCPVCRYQNLSFARKCLRCGHPLKEETVTAGTVISAR